MVGDRRAKRRWEGSDGLGSGEGVQIAVGKDTAVEGHAEDLVSSILSERLVARLAV